MRISRSAYLVALSILLSVFHSAASASRATIEAGYLVVPRIDVDGYGALELGFRIVFEDEYLLILESAVESNLNVSNSGVFDPLAKLIDIDEVELESGEIYALQIGLVSQSDVVIFRINEVVLLNPTDPPLGTSPSVEADPQAVAMYSQQCGSCHGVGGAGTAAGPPLLACANCDNSSVLSDYIANTMPLGQASSCDSDCASLLANYILGVFNANNEVVTGQTVGFLRTLADTDTLRKAAQQLLSRLPTLEEIQQVSTARDTGLEQAIRGMMEEPAFYARLSEIFNDYLLTDKYHSRNGSEAAIRLLSSDDYPNRRWFDPDSDARAENFEELRRNANNGVAREPLELINYVVKNNKPFTEILTADYMMMNSFSAKTFGIQNLTFKNPDDASEFVRVSLADTPHAGILTSPMFLNRYPTTSTNRNRGRARVVFDLFLDTDILAIEGVRPGNSVDITTPIPTINNPECSKCHSTLDPVASTFQNWNHKGQYRPARLERGGWYTDMESRGFNGEPMPLAGNVDSSVQWLAAKIASDPKFPRAITRILLRGLTGKEPLQAPTDSASSQLAQDAFIAERSQLNAMQERFVADNYNLKTLVLEIMTSAYWRASGLTSDANPAAFAETGASYLLSPEQLDRKILSLLGFDWRNSLDQYYKDRDRSRSSKLIYSFHQIYGGIDSDSVTSRLTTPNGLMGAMQLRMANELACYAVPHDFWLPAQERKLFLFLDGAVSPYGEAGTIDEATMLSIRQNIQYLHEYLLGERLALNSAELQFTEQLYMNSLNRGRQLMLNSGGSSSTARLPRDCDRVWDFEGNDLRSDPSGDRSLVEDRQYVIRAWMAVLAYLFADYKFLYQ